MTVKACVVMVLPDKVVEERDSEDKLDVFDSEGSLGILVCEAVDVVETVESRVLLLSGFEVNELAGSFVFEVIELE